MLTTYEKHKLREAAYAISVQENWDALSWDEAWSGMYTKEPNEKQLDSNYHELEKMALSIKHGGDGYENYDAKECIRMIWLDDIFNNQPRR